MPATTEMTVDPQPLIWAIKSASDSLTRAIARARADLNEAEKALALPARPGGMSTRILSQSALDVDTYSTRLNTLLDVANQFLTEEQLVSALKGGN
jgi:hypothetical protein